MTIASVFSRPYFVHFDDEETPFSRAGQLLREIAESGNGANAGVKDAEIALQDFLNADAALCEGEVAQRYLSEAVLSAIALGIAIGGTPVADSISTHQRKAGLGSHAEDHALKAEALAFYAARGHEFKSKAAAARYIVKHVAPVKVETVQRWLAGARK